MFMISLAIIFGLFFTAFSVQNITPVTLVFGEFSAPAMPIYIIILFAILLGVLIAWIFNLIDAVTSFFILRNKEGTIRELKKTISELIRRVHNLELDTDSKKSKKKPDSEDEESEDENSL